jgi:hypothetical protein
MNILWYQKLWIIKLFHITKIIFGISRLIFQILPSQLYLILKKELGRVVDWSLVDKEDYLSAMERSPIKDIEIKYILKISN